MNGSSIDMEKYGFTWKNMGPRLTYKNTGPRLTSRVSMAVAVVVVVVGRGLAYNRRIISALEPLLCVYFLSQTALALEPS